MRATRRNRRQAGFTLMELMTVVAFIAISAAVAAPAMMGAMANRRAGDATHHVVRIGARARSEALAYGRAHVLLFRDTSSGTGGTYGTLELWRGRANRCSANNWTTVMTGGCGSSDNCVESLDMGTFAYPTNRVELRMLGTTNGALCFQPDGEMLYAPPGGLWSSTPPTGTEGVRFRVRRITSGSPTGVDRLVVFPFGSTPRIVR